MSLNEVVEKALKEPNDMLWIPMKPDRKLQQLCQSR